MRFVPSISPPPLIVGERKVNAIKRINQPPRPRDHDEQPLDAEHLPQPAPYPEERRKAQRRITNEPVMIDQRSGLERRRFNLFHHIDEEA